MSVTSIFVNRTAPWDGLGTSISTATSSSEALRIADLNWNVIQKPIMINNQEYKRKVANINESNNHILGLVSPTYKIVQNHTAFSFIDDLLSTVNLETAGVINSGERVWMLANLDPIDVVGDTVEPYLVFTNGHDGSHGVKVCLTPIRVVCQNTLTLALETSPRMWSTCHTGDIALKLEDAKLTLQLASNYLEELPGYAEGMVETNIYQNELVKFIIELFPMPKDASKLVNKNITHLRDTLLEAYTNTPDIERFKNTTWGVYNATVDMVTHMTPLRNTTTFKENLFSKVVEGHPIIQKAQELLIKIPS